MRNNRILHIFLLILFVLSSTFSQSAKAQKADGDEVMIQGFNWLSWQLSGGWYNFVATKAGDLSTSGIDAIWMPPPSKANAMAAQGYLPSELYDLNSEYGTQAELQSMITMLHDNNVKVLADIVINHRVGTTDWGDFTNPTWGCWAVCIEDEWGDACGGNDTGAGYAAARDLDHNNTTVQNDLKAWLLWLKNDIGFDGWRYDYVKGFSAGFIQEYNTHTSPWFAVGECWEDYNTIVNWLNGSGSDTYAFDFGLKGALHSAFNDNNLSYLNAYGNMPSISGTHPARSVTFLENHDTGWPQNHWPFPDGKVLQGYAYILTHPGTPMVFWNHYYEWGMHDQIQTMIQIRKVNGIHSTSTLNIIQSQTDLYAAVIDDKVAMKLGSGSWTPSGSEWVLATSGVDFAIWTKGGLENPTVEITPSGGHYTDPITVTITATDNNDPAPIIYYTTDGSEPNTGSQSGSGSVSFDVSENTIVRAIAIDNEGNESQESTASYTIGEIPGFKVYFKKPESWTAAKIYYWDTQPVGVMPGVTWPGADMESEGNGWYCFEFPSVASTSLIFNDGDANQTPDLYADAEAWYDNGWVSAPDMAPAINFTPEGGSFSTPVIVTITATDDNDPAPILYYTTDGTSATTSSPSATGQVEITVNSTTTIKAIAADDQGNVSEEQSATYMFGGSGFTVHFKKPVNWPAAKIYYWEVDPAGVMPAVDWPGVDMIAEGDDWYYFDFPGVNSTNLIFNNGNSGTGNQTDNLLADGDMWYDEGWQNQPEATNVTFTGTLDTDEQLTGNYSYSHPDGTAEGNSEYTWYRADDISGTNAVMIGSATGINYTLTANDIGYYIAFGVIPVDANGVSGNEVISGFDGPVEDIISQVNNVTASQLQLYPNPTSTSVAIASPGHKISAVVVYDITGRCLDKVEAIDNEYYLLNLREMENGIMFVKIMTANDKIHLRKIIKTE